MSGTESLFSEGMAPAPVPETLSKRAFADHIGVSPGRVTQLIGAGLPVEPNGRIHRQRGVQWYRENIDANRRKGARDDQDVAPSSARRELDRARADREKLRLERERGNLIDRKEAERTVFERARAERDAWIGWVSRASALLAADVGADTAAVFASLDRLTREHLAELASRPLEDLSA